MPKRKYESLSSYVAKRKLGMMKGSRRAPRIARPPSRRFAAEKKVIDLGNASYACNSTGSVTALNLCSQGTDYTNRVGRLIQLKSVGVKGLIAVDSITSNSAANYARVCIVYDDQPNGGALPAITDIFDTASPISWNNLTNRDRFKVLACEEFALGGINTTATQTYSSSPTSAIVNIFKKLNLQTQYGGTGATIGAVQHGSLLLVTQGSQPSGSAHVLNAATRVRFTDA